MTITAFGLGPLQTNCYLLENDGKCVVVDPGGDPSQVLAHMEKHSLTLTHILNTHIHFDHTYGNKALSGATGAPILCHKDDLVLLESWLGRGGDMGLPPVDEYEVQTIEPGPANFAGLECSIFLTPGHSPGSLTYYFPEAGAAFVGDLIFFRSIGRTDFPGGDLDTLKRSVKNHIFTLPPETRLLSGHGPETSAGDEMNHNPYFQGY